MTSQKNRQYGKWYGMIQLLNDMIWWNDIIRWYKIL